MTSIPARSGTPSRASPSFSVVLFDLDDTLFAHREAVGLGVTAHRRTIGGPTADADDVAEIARWHALEEKHYHRYLGGELDFLGQRRARVRDFVASYCIALSDAAADRWYDDYYLEYKSAWSLHDDAIPCLRALRDTIPGVRFGLITNGELEYQASKIDGVGLDQYIEHTIASGQLDFAKPDVRIFEHACSMFEVEPSAAVYVGDRLQTDAIGAASAGLTGVWLDREHTATRAELARATASGVSIISTLVELPPLLAR